MPIVKLYNYGRHILVRFITSVLPVSAFAIYDEVILNLCGSLSGLNIGADKEAAEHFLSALSLQESTSGDTSDQLWFTLRRAFLSMVNVFQCASCLNLPVPL